MAGHAVITPGDRTASRLRANMARVQWSGMDSWLTTQAPADCALTVAKMTWNFGDGSALASGFHVSHQYNAAGTYVVTLTAYFTDGSVVTANETVTIGAQPDFASYFAKYVSWATGNDANPGTQALPYKTIERAFHDWRTGGKLGTTNWGAIFLNKGETHTYNGTQDSTHDANPDYGPLLISSYGLGTRPLVNVNNFDLVLDENHDASFDHGIIIDGVDWYWLPGAGTRSFQLAHRGHQLTNSYVQNARLLVTSNFGGGNLAFYNTEFHHALLGPFCSNVWLDFESCVFAGNGQSGDGVGPGPFDHQLYLSTACQYAGLRGCTFDQTGAVAAFAGLKTSGARKVYVGNPIVTASDCGFDIGSNPDDQNTQDLVIDAPVLNSVIRFGFYPASCDRVVIRNHQVFQGCSNAVLRLQPLNSSKPIADLQLLGGSAYKPTGPFVYYVSGPNLLTRVVVKGNATQKAVASGPFLKTEPGIDFTGATFDGNDYFRDGGQPGDAGFALISNGDKSFLAWQTIGQDPAGIYADPAFVGPNDLHLQPASPCVDHGLTLPLLALDAFGNARPIGFAYDIGCAESGIGGGFMTWRQYPADMDVPVTELGFESQAAASAAVLAAIADNPICPITNTAWVFPGTDSGQANHVFVKSYQRWERGAAANLWFIICGQDDGTEAHETGIPGYAIAFGYDSMLQGMMTKYTTDVGDPTVASKNSHYEVVWRKKEKAAPGGPPPNLNPIASETYVGPLSTRVLGGQNSIQLLSIFSETKTLPVAPDPGPDIPPPPPPIWSESFVGTVVPNTGITQYVPLLKIFSRSAVNDIKYESVPPSLKFDLVRISSESAAIQLDYTIQGGNSGFNLLAIFSASNILDPSVTSIGGSNNQGLEKVWSESDTVNPTILRIGGTRHIGLTPISSESATQPCDVNQGGVQGVGLGAISSESNVLAVVRSLGGNLNVPLLSTFSETFLGALETQTIYPNLVNLIAFSSQSATIDLTAATIATPQAASVGDFSGGVQLSEEF